MVSTVAENRPNEYMSFKHLGEVKDGIEDTSSEQAKQWSGAVENYTLIENNTGTDLKVEMEGNISDDFKEYFLKAWPEALEKVKKLAEEK
jgi:hypothetical protein